MQPLTCHNVFEYGADRTGKEDSNKAIQKALDAAIDGPCRSV
jgi:hypothetical protein